MTQFNPSLQQATLLCRYKRFLADVRLENNEVITIYCANTGAMTGCAEPGVPIWYSESSNLKRKYRYTWELSSNPQHDLICINTLRANSLIAEAINQGVISQLKGYQTQYAEVKLNEKSRLDFLLSNHVSESLPIKENRISDAYIEVKSVTLLSPATENQREGFFPDAKTVRGQKHLNELMELKSKGYRAILIFAVLHSGIDSVSVASHIDPVYAKLFYEAVKKGVEVYAYKATMSQTEMSITAEIPVTLIQVE